jgi:XTP/dITP diphosphohydrolase
MYSIIFATNNLNKIHEIRQQLGNEFHIESLKDCGIDIDIPEPHATLEANANEKSSTIYKLTGKSCFSEDTGLEVFALNGEPGVKSARYAGDHCSTEDNINKLLEKLGNETNRKAQFRTVISLQLEGEVHLFEGICAGEITKERRGVKGFGYDPVFVPSGSTKSFAEMSTDEKSKISHRGKAVSKLISFLHQKFS